MAKLANLARMSTATAGTGTITLGSAVSGCLTFADADVVSGETVSYGISDGANSEVGTGVATDTAGTWTLTRSVTKSTNSDAAINLSGSAQVFITARAEGLVTAAVPAFSVHKNGTDQTGIADNTNTALSWSTELFDIGGYFASDAWTPPAGVVTMSAAATVSGTWTAGSNIGIGFAKNGTLLKRADDRTGAANGGGVVAAITDVANGSDSYTAVIVVDVGSGTATVSGNSALTWFTGHWIGPDS